MDKENDLTEGSVYSVLIDFIDENRVAMPKEVLEKWADLSKRGYGDLLYLEINTYLEAFKNHFPNEE
jgi:hypothetical protein